MVDQNFANLGELVAYLQTLPQDLRVFIPGLIEEQEITHVSVLPVSDIKDDPERIIYFDSEHARDLGED